MQKEKNTKFTWLHLSDIHIGGPNTEENLDTITFNLFEDLKKLKDEIGFNKIDVIFFTGDLVYCGDKNEFTKLNRWLKVVEEKFRNFIQDQSPILIPVPGNHDLLRPHDDRYPKFFDLINDSDRVKDLWRKELTVNIWADFITPAFKCYMEWLNDKKRPFYLENFDKGLLPGDLCYTLKLENNKSIGILGLNTSIYHMADKFVPDGVESICSSDIKGNLILNYEQIINLFKDTFMNNVWCPKHDFCVFLTHHPISWQNVNGLELFNENIRKTFDLHLFGHMHENELIADVKNFTPEKITSIQSNALFGKKERNGYWLGQVKFKEKRKAEILFSPRIQIKDKSYVTDPEILGDKKTFTLIRKADQSESEHSNHSQPSSVPTQLIHNVYKVKNLIVSPHKEDKYGLYKELNINGISQKMRWINPGSFLYRGPENCYIQDVSKVNKKIVTIEKGFWIADTPCTQEFWNEFININKLDSHELSINPNYKSPKRPIEEISWHVSKAFCDHLNSLCLGLKFRLPMQIEWEYACRATTTTSTYKGDLSFNDEYQFSKILENIAIYNGNSNIKKNDSVYQDALDTTHWTNLRENHEKSATKEVKSKEPNLWGLYDMLGNVWEWCEDAYDESDKNDNIINKRVKRGGSWKCHADSVHASRVGYEPPENDKSDIGFRLVADSWH